MHCKVKAGVRLYVVTSQLPEATQLCMGETHDWDGYTHLLATMNVGSIKQLVIEIFQLTTLTCR